MRALASEGEQRMILIGTLGRAEGADVVVGTAPGLLSMVGAGVDAAIEAIGSTWGAVESCDLLREMCSFFGISYLFLLYSSGCLIVLYSAGCVTGTRPKRFLWTLESNSTGRTKKMQSVRWCEKLQT